MNKNIQEALFNNDLEELGNILFDISQYCKTNNKYYSEVLDDKNISKKFKQSRKHLLEALNLINDIKTLDPKFCEKGSGVKIGETITMQIPNHLLDDYELGLRTGYVFQVLDGLHGGKTLQVKSFDSDKYAIFEGDIYLENCSLTRLS